MGTPFYQNVPSWIIRYLSHTKCSECSTRIKKKHIIAIGIRELKDNTATPYIEYKCPNCGHRHMMSFGGHTKGTVEELCCMLLEETQNRRRIKQAQINEKCRAKSTEMTDREVDEFLSSLKECKNYVDLLKEIGAIEWLESDQESDEG